MAARFWVGGAGGSWSATSGGAGGASQPTSADSATFDGSSGSGAVTIPGLVAASVTINNTGIAVTMTGTLTVIGDVTLTAGSLDTNGQAVSAADFLLSGTGVRTLSLGASLITLSGTNIPWSMATTTNLTFNCGTSRITFTGSGINTFATGGKTFYDVVINNLGSQTMSISGGTAVFHDLTINGSTGAATGVLSISGFTVNGTFTILGQAANRRIMVVSSTTGTRRTITCNGPTNFQYVTWQDVLAAGTSAPFTGTLMGDALGNANIVFEDPLTLYRVGDAGNWSAAQWSLSSAGTADQRTPLAQDTVFIDDGATGTITVDSPRLGASLDLSNFAGTLNLATTATVFGSLTLSSVAGFALTGSAVMSLQGRASHRLTSAGRTFPGQVKFEGPGGYYTLADNLVCAAAITLSNGTLDGAGSDVTGTSFVSSAGNVARTLILGSGTWTQTGTGVIWNVTSNVALVILPGTSRIVATDQSPAGKTFTGGGRTYAEFEFQGGAGTLTMGGSTFTTLHYAAGSQIVLTAGTTTSLQALDSTGAPGSLVSISSSVAGTPATLSKASGVVSADYLSLKDVTAAGGAQWYAGIHSTNVSGNSGWTFTAPATGAEKLLTMMGRL